MARHQYILGGPLDWVSGSGNALVAILNPNGSGKKLTIRHLELTQFSERSTLAVPELRYGTAAAGLPLQPTPHDSSLPLPAGIRCLASATADSLTATPTLRFLAPRELQSAVTPIGTRIGARSRLLTCYRSPRASSGAQPLTIAPGQCLLLVPSNRPMRVIVTFMVSGSSQRCFSLSFFSACEGRDLYPLAIDSAAGSGLTVTLQNLTVEPVGTLDTPYYQLVPVGTINPDSLADGRAALTVEKMDSASPSPDAALRAYQDVCLLPCGMPAAAVTPSSAGTPKLLNYLTTKDFDGPRLRAVFPETCAFSAGAQVSDTAGTHTAHRLSDTFLARHAGLTIREGEALAIVPAAEEATSGNLIAFAGWCNLQLHALIDVEPKFIPTLSLTGLKNPSEVRIFPAGSTTAVAGAENVSGGVFWWVFDPDDFPGGVDIAILSLGFLNLRLLSIALGSSDLLIPIQQQIDRQYLNP
jgi:hypothetical protein